MKNKVLAVILLVLIIILIIAVFSGIKIGSFEIKSFSGLIEKNTELEEKINSISVLTSVEYPDTIKELEKTYESYNVQKDKYEELLSFSEKNEKQFYETKQYDIGYLWEIVGRYANKYNLTINLDIKNGSSTNLYDLNFNVSGEYVNISQFIKDIEDNSDLNFRIYNFNMSGSETVASSFTVKDVNIDPSTIITTANLE